MNIGYIKGHYNIEDQDTLERLKKKLEVEVIYTDEINQTTGLTKLKDYVREGDTVVIEELSHLGSSPGEFIENVYTFHKEIEKGKDIANAVKKAEEISKIGCRRV